MSHVHQLFIFMSQLYIYSAGVLRYPCQKWSSSLCRRCVVTIGATAALRQQSVISLTCGASLPRWSPSPCWWNYLLEGEGITQVGITSYKWTVKCDDHVFTYSVSKFICRWYCSVNRRLRFFLGLTTFVASIGSSVSCPDGKLSCPTAFTCCLLPNGEYGCCPYPKVNINAVGVVQVIWSQVFQQFPAFFIFLSLN